MFFAAAYRGLEGGGFTGQNGPLATISRTFNPEFAWNYELGLRSRFLDNRAQVNATLYQMDYSNLQVTTIIGTSRVTDNAANARIRGLEVETEFIPVDGLTRSEESRVGTECGRTCRSRWSPDQSKKKETT